MPQIQILDAACNEQRANWIRLWEQWPEREVFAHPDYVCLTAGPNDKALCATGEDGEARILYPFLLRSLGGEPYCQASLRDCTDIVTPYGYGGPFQWGGSLS